MMTLNHIRSKHEGLVIAADGTHCIDETTTSPIQVNCPHCMPYITTYLNILETRKRQRLLKRVHTIIRATPPYGTDYVRMCTKYKGGLNNYIAL